jgi:hypothetical protein
MLSLYLDTSVYGGFFDPEFELWTKILFNQINDGKFKILYSRLVDIELNNAPSMVREFALSITVNNTETLEISDEAGLLAASSIEEKVVGGTSISDCLHIAIATLNNADILVSWNFKHIVNVNRIRGYNSVNYKQGHKLLEIRTPREIIEI